MAQRFTTNIPDFCPELRSKTVKDRLTTPDCRPLVLGIKKGNILTRLFSTMDD